MQLHEEKIVCSDNLCLSDIPEYFALLGYKTLLVHGILKLLANFQIFDFGVLNFCKSVNKK